MEYFELKEETPAKKNSKIMNTKTHRMFPSKRYQEWHDYVAFALRPKIRKCIEDRCYIVLIFCHGDARRRDSDNGVSSIFDALVDFSALKDDCWQILRNHHVFNCYEKGNPYCKVYIFEPEEREEYKRFVLNCIEQFE